MPSAVPITFPAQNQQYANQYHYNHQHHQHQPVGVPTPSPRWRSSPMSYKLANSFGSRFYTSTSPGPLVGPLDGSDFKMSAMLSSSFENDHHSRLIRALGGEDPLVDDFCRNYTCCGLDLQDLHALLEHFEESHVVVLDSTSSEYHYNAVPHGFDPDSMELDNSSSSSSSNGSSAFDTSVLRKLPVSSPSKPKSSAKAPAYPRNQSQNYNTVANSAATAFNQYASYSDFSSLMPGAAPAPPSQSQSSSSSRTITPTLLSTPSMASSSTNTTPTPSRPTSPSTTLSRPSSNLLLSKPFKCPTKGCNKSYKQANGLKYHITHGQCNFVPRDPAMEGVEEKPYICQVGSCTRRYKNMNGLRYHYQHSGAHGAVGLALLASGQHILQQQAQGSSSGATSPTLDDGVEFSMDP